MNTEVKIGQLTLKNPVTVASGTAGYGEELAKYFNIGDLGAIFTKGLSLNPRNGNSGQRILETPSGVLNSIGLENVGLEKFLKDKLPFLIKQGATVIPNVAGHSIEENVELCKTLSNEPGVAAIELNVSCPNVKEGGIAFGQKIEVFSELLEKVRNVTNGVLIVKLSPNVTSVAEFAMAAEKLGADAVSTVNTFLGMKIDTKTGKPLFRNKVAGLSGPAIRPLAVRIVYEIFQKINIPVIGLGGISTFDDMLEFTFAGATAISVGTMNMVEPNTAPQLIESLNNYMIKNNVTDFRELIGFAHRS